MRGRVCENAKLMWGELVLGCFSLQVRDIRKAYQKLFMSTDELVGFEERLASLVGGLNRN